MPSRLLLCKTPVILVSCWYFSDKKSYLASQLYLIRYLWTWSTAGVRSFEAACDETWLTDCCPISMLQGEAFCACCSILNHMSFSSLSRLSCLTPRYDGCCAINLRRDALTHTSLVKIFYCLLKSRGRFFFCSHAWLLCLFRQILEQRELYGVHLYKVSRVSWKLTVKLFGKMHHTTVASLS